MSIVGMALALGVVNWVATEIVVTSVIFEDIRRVVDGLGKRLKPRHPCLSRKVCYFLNCALCVGIWIGFIEAFAFGGPLQPHGLWASWAAFIANGLLYKAPGHVLLQLNAWFHNRNELFKAQIQLVRRQTDSESLEASWGSATGADRVSA